MGSQPGKAELDLLEMITTARAQLEFGQITLDQAQAVLIQAMNQLNNGEVSFGGDALEDVNSKLTILKIRIEELHQQQQKDKASAMLTQQTDDAKEQLAKSRKVANLVPLYSKEYGDGAVAALLGAGQSGGGYRYPKEGLTLDPISAEVHRLACKGGGFSSHTSQSNGLVMRIREQSAIVVGYAYEAGYPVEDDDVQEAMAELAKQIAFTLDSDSGARDYKKEHMPRGMAYNMDTRAPGLDPSVLKGGFSNDPAVKLESHRRAVPALELRISKAFGQDRAKLVAELQRINKEIQELEKLVRQ